MSADAIHELVRRINDAQHWHLSETEISIYAAFLASQDSLVREELQHVLIRYHGWHRYVQAIQDPQHPDHDASWARLYDQCRKIVHFYYDKWSWMQTVNEDDITQIAATRVWQKIHTYRYRSAFVTWCTPVVLNVIRNLQRQQFSQSYPHDLRSLLDDERDTNPHSEPETVLTFHELLDEIVTELHKHPDSRLLTILAMYLDGEPKLRDIGKQLHVGTTRAYTLLKLLRQIIRQIRDDDV